MGLDVQGDGDEAGCRDLKRRYRLTRHCSRPAAAWSISTRDAADGGRQLNGSIVKRTRDSVPRHLDQVFLEPTLNRGKAIECFLGAGDEYGREPTIRWASVRNDGEGFVVRLYEACDPRDPAFLDVYEFSSRPRNRMMPFARNATTLSRQRLSRSERGAATQRSS